MKQLLTLILCMISFNSLILAQSWDSLAPLPVGLAFPVVVELNGEIHVVGGGGPAGATDLHLRYKPAMDAWDTLAPVPYLAQQPAGAVLDGKIHYFGGGYPNSGTPLDNHYAYNPSTDAWDSLAPLMIPRVIMVAGVINGKLYAMSGQPTRLRMDEYDPLSDTWVMKNDLPDINFWYSALVVHDNEMYRFGGGGYTVPTNLVHKYNSASDTWTSTTTLPLALHAPAGCVLNGQIFLTGGYNGGPKDDVQVYDPVSNTFSTSTSLPLARSYHAMVTIDSCIYSVGGHNSLYSDMDQSLLRYCVDFTSIEEAVKDSKVSIYPNPAKDIVNLEMRTMQPVLLNIFDMTGRLQISREIDGPECRINISDLGDGFYLYTINEKNGALIHSGKLIVSD